MGFAIPPPEGRVCHWSAYMREGMFDLHPRPPARAGADATAAARGASAPTGARRGALETAFARPAPRPLVSGPIRRPILEKGPAKQRRAAWQTPIELHFWPTPNGYKISHRPTRRWGLPYEVRLRRHRRGATSFGPPASSRSSPNNRMPRHRSTPTGPAAAPGLGLRVGRDSSQYLARKTGRFHGTDERARIAVEELADVAGWAVSDRWRDRPTISIKYAPTMDPPGSCPTHRNATSRSRPPLRRARLPPRWPRLRRRRVFHRRHGALALGEGLGAAGADPRRQAELAAWLDRIAARPAVERGHGWWRPKHAGGRPAHEGRAGNPVRKIRKRRLSRALPEGAVCPRPPPASPRKYFREDEKAAGRVFDLPPKALRGRPGRGDRQFACSGGWAVSALCASSSDFGSSFSQLRREPDQRDIGAAVRGPLLARRPER